MIKMSFSGDSRWLLLHNVCLDDKTTPDQLEYIFSVICSSLSFECTDHLKTFLDDNPLPVSHGHYTRFCWSVELHNHINNILGKPNITMNEAKEIYSSRGHCIL